MNALYNSATPDEKLATMQQLAPKFSYGEIDTQPDFKAGSGLLHAFDRKGLAYIANSSFEFGGPNDTDHDIDFSAVMKWRRVLEPFYHRFKGFSKGTFTGNVTMPKDEDINLSQILPELFQGLTAYEGKRHTTFSLASKSLIDSGHGEIAQANDLAFSSFAQVLDMLWMISGGNTSRYASTMEYIIGIYRTAGLNANLMHATSKELMPIRTPDGTYLGNLLVRQSTIPVTDSIHINVPEQTVHPEIIKARDDLRYSGASKLTLDIVIDSDHPDAGSTDLLLTSELNENFIQNGIPLTMSEGRRDTAFTIDLTHLGTVQDTLLAILDGEPNTDRLKSIRSVIPQNS